MGVAVKNVEGMTLHAALNFGHKKKRLTSRSNSDLRTMWEGVDFLFIDKVSMISCEFLFKISEALSQATRNTTSFGGINIIFASDFAQLPPVKQSRLYSDIDTNIQSTTSQTQSKVMGKILWLSVDVIVELTVVMRQTGPENENFVNLLNRLRLGKCTDKDYNLLNTHVIVTGCYPIQ